MGPAPAGVVVVERVGLREFLCGVVGSFGRWGIIDVVFFIDIERIEGLEWNSGIGGKQGVESIGRCWIVLRLVDAEKVLLQSVG